MLATSSRNFFAEVVAQDFLVVGGRDQWVRVAAGEEGSRLHSDSRTGPLKLLPFAPSRDRGTTRWKSWCSGPENGGEGQDWSRDALEMGGDRSLGQRGCG